MLSVSSYYQVKAESTAPSSMIIEFELDGIDIKNRVKTFPAISKNANDVIGRDVTVTCENATRTFNDIDQSIYKLGTYKFGFITVSGSREMVQLFGGQLTGAKTDKSTVSMVFSDKLARLKRKRVGSGKNPTSLNSYTPADLAWEVLTNHGDLSNITSTSNPDINYTSWQDWKAALANNNYLLDAYSQGAGVINVINLIKKMSNSLIYTGGDDKFYFAEWGIPTTAVKSIDDNHITNTSRTFNASNIVNTANVSHGYNVTSMSWTGEAEEIQAISVTSWGTQSAVYTDTTVWHANSQSASNFARAIVDRRNNINARLKVDIPLIIPQVEIGDTIAVTTQIYSYSAQLFNILDYTIDVLKGRIKMTLDDGAGR